MEKNIPVAEIMMLDLMQSDAIEDYSNKMRVYMFCMDMENVGKELMGEEYSELLFIEKFIEKIQESSGYLSFASFCEVDLEGLEDLAEKVFKLLA